MATDSKIQWTHHTFNPWRGCTKISDGCKHCYADTLSARNPKVLGVWGPRGTRVVAAESYWKEPRKWAVAAAAAGERHRVFCASLADVAEGPETMPAESWNAVQDARHRLRDVILATCDHLDWLLLTKRPENLTKYFAREVLERCWIGTSCENQETADRRIPYLLACPAAVRFLSLEPLLGAINLPGFNAETAYCPICRRIVPCTLSSWHEHKDAKIEDADAFDPSRHPASVYDLIHWCIVGGESGPRARPCDLAWIRAIVKQCEGAGVPVFVKQLGGNLSDDDLRECTRASGTSMHDAKGGDLSEWPEDLRVRQFPAGIGGGL